MLVALTTLPGLCFVLNVEIKVCFVSTKIQSNMFGSLDAHARLNSRREEVQGLSTPGPTAVMANTGDVALFDWSKAVDMHCRGKRFNATEIITCIIDAVP